MFKSNFSKKALIMVVSLILLVSTLLVACNPTGSEFNEFPSLPAAGEVSSNGGIAVAYGDYIYYVNGYNSSYTGSNKYEGDVTLGNIVRIAKSDLDEIVEINNEDTTTSQKTEKIAEQVYEKSELVVPKVVYSGNTTDTSVTGIYIFGNKLYYTTPNDDLTANGSVKYSELCIYSADLDGKNNTKLFTMTSNSLVMSLMGKDSKVYAMYVETTATDTTKAGLYCVELTASNRTATLISESATTVSFDKNTLSAYYLNKDGSICSYTVGDESETVLVEKTKDSTMTYTIVSNNKGTVYFKQVDSTNTSLKYGLLAIKKGDEKAVSVFADESKTGIFGYEEGVVLADKLAESSLNVYQLIYTSGSAEEIIYVLPESSQGSTITINKIDGDTLYYTIDSKLYSLNLKTVLESGEPATGDDITFVAYSVASTTGWAAYDVLGEYVFSFSGDKVQVVKYDAEKEANITTDITSVKPSEEE